MPMKNITSIMLMAAFFTGSYVFSQQRETQPDLEKENLLKLSEFFHQRHQTRKAEVEKFAFENGLSVKMVSDGRESQIMYIDELGMPQSYITYNFNAAQTTGTNQLWTGGTTGLNLMGNGYLIGIWDAGGVRTTHQEFGSRVTIMDGASLSDHGTHVGGTMIASGVQSSARGMAQQATLRSYDWDDDYSEMATQAASGLTISNHSYGKVRGWTYSDGYMFWLGNTSISETEDYLFGFYDGVARDLDIVAFNAPNYLMVWSAGNDRNDTWSGGHYAWINGSWKWSTATRDQDGGVDGYDCIPQHGVAKNILTVGAVNDITGGYTSPASVVMSDFSSWGPTDDGRIKPDIVANGVSLYSTSSDNNASYTTFSGTSMASPNTTGTLALLQEHYRNVRGRAMSAAALKGLVINTASEAGPNDGPDYMFGWGLLNAVGAADKITQDNTNGGLIVEGILNNSQTIDYTYYSDGSDINVTLSWTDPAGTPPAAALNPTTLMLVNDLNLSVIRQSNSATYSPWVLNPANPAAAATKGNNIRDNVETVNVKNPAAGYYTVRITHSGSLSGGSQAYALIITGLKTPPTKTYCSARATSTNFEMISRVQMGTINNYSGRSAGGYHDYRGLFTQISKGSSQTITVTMTGGATSSWGRVYIDWNQDGDFNDAGETYVLGSGTGPYSTSIAVPASALDGYTTMRVRVGYDGTPSACGTFTYGETEDYTIKVGGTPGLWKGTISSDWFNPLNWDNGEVPTSDVNVTIPTSAPFQVSIFGGNAYCNNLVIQSGKVVTVNGNNINFPSYLYVYGNLDSDVGQFSMTGSYSFLFFRGSTNTWWDDDNENDSFTNVRVQKDTPTAILSMWQSMTCSGTFYIVEGIFQSDPGWTLTVLSTSTNAFRIEDGGTLRLWSTRTIDVAGRIYFMNGSKTEITGGTLKVGGNLRVDSNTTHNIALTGATLIFQGSANQYIEDADGGTLQLNDVTIDKTGGTVFINGAALNINGNLVISNGVLSCNNGPTPTTSYNINIKGNWTNNNFPTGFVPGTARVRFNGSGHQIVGSSENFNILEANMGSALRINNVAHTVTCNQYDWTSGGIDVLKGTFTALDLADNGLYGNYYVNPDGTINLHQDAFSLIDLNGKLTFSNGGTINVYGGSDLSYWSWAGNAEINMNGGVLDFKNQGIYIYNSLINSFTHNITGGTIRTSGGLTCSRTGFTPAGGTFEFYGSTNASLNMVSGSQLRNVKIDKSSMASGLNLTGEPVYDKRSGQLLSDGTRANNISLISNIDILGNLTITTGSLTLNGIELNIKQNCSVSGTLNMTNPSDVLTVGEAFSNWLEFKSGSIANITAGTINIYGWIIPRSGSSFNILPGNTVVVKGGSGGGLSNHESSASYGNVILQKNSGEWSCIDLSATSPIIVNGSFTISPDNEFYMQNHNLTVNGAFTDASTSKIYMKDYSKKALAGSYSTGEQSTNTATRGGLLTINSDYTIQGLLDIADGNAVLTQGFGINSTGVLKINGGSFINNRADISNWTEIKGSLQLVDGLFELTNNHPYFNSGSSSVISGGTIRTGGAFRAVDPNVFKHTGGVVEITGNNNNGAIYCYNGNYFHNLVINRSSLYSAFMNGEPVTINNDFTVNKGQLNTSSSLVTVSGNVAINSGGHLSVDAGGGLALAASKSVNVNNGGLIEFNGTSGMQSKITRKSSGYYALNVENGGKIAAVHTIFEYMNTNGVNLKSGAIVDPSNAFTSCIFRNGQSGGRLLTINNSQTFALNNAMFPNNSWGSNFNVYKSVNSGVVTFGGHSGGFSGGSYEYDPNNRIHWGGEVAGNVTLQGVDVVNGQDICFDASNTLTVAGGGSTFIVQNGGNVNLIAGHNIRMLEGTSVRSGAYLHAFISNDYCTLPPVMLAVDEESDTYDEIVSEKSAEVFETQTDDFFRVYPNPTNGRVMLEFSEPTSNTLVEVYGLIGERILAKEISGNSLYELDLSSQPQGIYLVKVSNGKSVSVKKIIKN